MGSTRGLFQQTAPNIYGKSSKFKCNLLSLLISWKRHITLQVNLFSVIHVIPCTKRNCVHNTNYGFRKHYQQKINNKQLHPSTQITLTMVNE